MKRLVILRAATLVVACAVAGEALSGTSASRAEGNREAARLVGEALRQETYGKNSQRSALLQSALQQAPDCEAAHWHSGQLKQDGRWVPYDELALRSADDARLQAYRQQREKCADTIEGHMEMARWCAKRRFADRQRAHLTRVVELDANHQEARQLLGYRSINGAWVSEAEVAAAKVHVAQVARSLKKWAPELEKILSGLNHRTARRRELALQQLRAIDDSSAIPAIASVLCSRDEETALLGIEALGTMRASEASAPLARLAVFSPSPAVRTAAAEQLKTRDKHSYVPMLLSAMATPVQSRAQLLRDPGGRLTYRHMFHRAGQYQQNLAVLDHDFIPIRSPQRERQYDDMDGDLARAFRLADQRDARESVRRRVFAQAVARQTAVALTNVAAGQFNRRLCEVLAATTGARLGVSPEKWWQWWNDRNEVTLAGYKQTVTQYRREGTTMLGSSPPPRRCECLVAGTLIWTDCGPVPVEQVKMGDRVLSQDPQTGRLACKPVLKTTVRPAGPLVQFGAGTESIRCSGGHPFWVSGRGWVKARELPTGSHLHGVNGAATIGEVEPAAAQQTYNLIVADFHTYFVGSTRILSHDNTIRGPVDEIVPGLTDR